MRELQHIRAVYPAGEIIKRIARESVHLWSHYKQQFRIFQHKQATLEILGLGRSSVSVHTRLSLFYSLCTLKLHRSFSVSETKNE